MNFCKLYCVNARVKGSNLHLTNMLSSYPLSVFDMRGKHACDFLALSVSALSLRGVQGGSTINNIRHL